MTPTEHGQRVAKLFDRIAHWYDFLNHFLSFGQDLYWRHRLVRFVHCPRGGTVVDLAAGTLDVSREILRQEPTAQVLALDFSRGMLRAGLHKLAPKASVLPVQADGRALPLPDACADAATIAFGIRNILPRHQAYHELYRILRPGGRLCILEFGSGKVRIWGGIYNVYLRYLLPWIGRCFSKDPKAYQYLAETIAKFPKAEALADELRTAGFQTVSYSPLSSGIVYLHIGLKAPGIPLKQSPPQKVEHLPQEYVL